MNRRKFRAIAIGASYGGITALSRILPVFPKGFPLPLFIVLHLPPTGSSMLPEIFTAQAKIEVKEAEDKEIVRAGVAYFAPPNYHLLVEINGTLALSSEEPEHYCRPSIDVLFESAADAYTDGLVGVILTGANDDGAQGARRVAGCGGVVLVQNPKTAEAPAMPEAAIAACPEADVMGIDEIAAWLARLPEGTDE